MNPTFNNFLSKIMLILEYGVPFIIVLSILVFFHELGHFLIARRAGVRVEVFSIGFGPEIFGFEDKHKTRWRFSAIPLGGYVRMFGDASAASTEDTKKMAGLTKEEKQYSLHAKHPSKKILVALGGPIANYILAIVVLTGLAFFKGLPSFSNIIGNVVKDMPAFTWGLQKNDQILSIGHTPIDHFTDIKKALSQESGKDTTLVFKRNDKEITKNIALYNVIPQTGKKEAITKLGIVPTAPVYKTLNFFDSLYTSLKLCTQLSYDTFQALGRIFKKSGTEELGGILSIADMAGKSSKEGLASSLWFLAILSINLGFINLLPVPLLDGGHVLLGVVEWIRGRPLSQKLQGPLFVIGAVVVFSLMILSNFNDVKRYLIPTQMRDKISEFFSGKEPSLNNKIK
jgi:regulator of sigma E protease